MNRLLEFLKSAFNHRSNIAVLDDFFPNLLTGFRVAEYNAYLEVFDELIVYSTYAHFQEAHIEYASLYPRFADRIKPYSPHHLKKCKLAYINFLNNAYTFLGDLERYQVPFIMNLYPGGGFGIDEISSDIKLANVAASNQLRHVITTQKITTNYIKDKFFKLPITEVFGGVIPMSSSAPDLLRNKKARGTVCFVAQKYMDRGSNKGYPEFIEAMEILAQENWEFTASVVGNFKGSDIAVSDRLRKRINWLGNKTTNDLREFYLTQNMIVSPNRPYLLHPGNFDGFPTGACVEASLAGVTMICSDPLDLNCHYTHDHEIIICDPTPASVANAVRSLLIDPQKCLEVGIRGTTKTKRLFSTDVQIGQRISLISHYLHASNDAPAYE